MTAVLPRLSLSGLMADTLYNVETSLNDADFSPKSTESFTTTAEAVPVINSVTVGNRGALSADVKVAVGRNFIHASLSQV